MDINKEIFEYGEEKIQRKIVRDEKLGGKIKHCFNYLKSHLPINKLENDNSFDFSKLKFDEGKNYDWFYLVNEKTTILIRQYRTHFTFFTFIKRHGEIDFFNKLAIFTIHDDFELINNDYINDEYVSNNFKTLSDILPKLVNLIEEDEIDGIWNSYNLKVPKFTKVKIALIGDDNVYSLDELNFACDEIFNMYLVKFAENETLAKLNDYKAGDMLGGGYTITRIQTEVINDYYYTAGISMKNNNFPDSKDSWADVYTLTRYYYDDLFFGDLKSKISEFVLTNHIRVWDMIYSGKINFYWELANPYMDKMFELFNNEVEKISGEIFNKFLPKNFKIFLEYNVRVNQKAN